MIEPARSGPGKVLAILGVLLQAGYFIALSVSGKITGEDHGVNQTAQQVMALRDRAAPVFWWGMLTALVGVTLIYIALREYQYRRRLLFWFLIVYSFLLIVAVPIGTLCGAYFIYFCLRYRREFFASRPHA